MVKKMFALRICVCGFLLCLIAPRSIAQDKSVGYPMDHWFEHLKVQPPAELSLKKVRTITFFLENTAGSADAKPSPKPVSKLSLNPDGTTDVASSFFANGGGEEISYTYQEGIMTGYIVHLDLVGDWVEPDDTATFSYNPTTQTRTDESVASHRKKGGEEYDIILRNTRQYDEDGQLIWSEALRYPSPKSAQNEKETSSLKREYHRNDDGQLLAIIEITDEGKQPFSSTFTYYPSGKVKGIQEIDYLTGGNTVIDFSFLYDDADRLTEMQEEWTIGSVNLVQKGRFTYNDKGLVDSYTYSVIENGKLKKEFQYGYRYTFFD